MSNRLVVNAVGFVSLLFGGLFAGFLVAVLFVELALRRFDASVYTQVRHVELVWLDGVATATLLPTLIATALLATIAGTRRVGNLWLTLTVLVLLVSVLVMTIVFNLPINTEQLTWDVQAPPADWASVRDRWQFVHAVRTGAGVLAFGCLIMALAGPGRVKSQVRPR